MQIKKIIRRWLYKRRIENTISILLLIDKTAQSKGLSRNARRSLRIIRRELENNKHDIIDLLKDISNRISGPSDGGGLSRVG